MTKVCNDSIKDYWELSLSGEIDKLWRLNNGVVEFTFSTFRIEQAGWEQMQLVTDNGKGPLIFMSWDMITCFIKQYADLQRSRK